MRKVLIVCGAVLVTWSALAVAQTALPGFFPIEEMGIFAPGELEVDVDLDGAMLEVAAGAIEDQDEDLVELIAMLDRVRVQVGAPTGADASAVARSIADASSRLENAGWRKILNVEDGDETVLFFALEGAGKIVGLTAFINDGAEEVVVLNIAGEIDPRTLGRLFSSMDDIDLEELMNSVEQ